MECEAREGEGSETEGCVEALDVRGAGEGAEEGVRGEGEAVRVREPGSEGEAVGEEKVID